jgi:hypothetical protein
MRHAVLISLLALALKVSPSSACSPVPGWLPPTPAGAFAASEVVVHAQVISQESDEQHYNTTARIRTIKILKGTFSGDMVSTAAGSLCGVGTFEVGHEYVFFFARSGRWFVSNLVQPQSATTQELLRAINAMPK